MDKLLDIMLCSGVVLIELICVIALGLFIQLVMYRVFKINLVKEAVLVSRKFEKYLDSKFYL